MVGMYEGPRPPLPIVLGSSTEGLETIMERSYSVDQDNLDAANEGSDFPGSCLLIIFHLFPEKALSYDIVTIIFF